MKNMQKLIALTAAGMLTLGSTAVADSISFNGTVTSTGAVPVYAPIGGRVEKVDVRQGDVVAADAIIVELATDKVYAQEDGVITGIFGQPGDSAERLASRYGAVMYMEGEVTYTVNATFTDTYRENENALFHVGDEVYLVSRNSSSRTGNGVITMVNGTAYSVEVRSGKFQLNETVNIFRENDHEQRIGSGTINRTNPVGVNGSGSIVSVNVKDGQKVSRGDVLFETLPGLFDSYVMTGSTLQAGVDGVVASVNAAVGTSVQKNSVLATVYPSDSIRVEGSVPESSLGDLHLGDPVVLEFNHTGKVYKGAVESISHVASAAPGAEASFSVIITFTPDESIRYGMNTVVTSEGN